MKAYTADNFPIVAEFILTATLLNLASQLTDDENINLFMKLIEKRCLTQGLDRARIANVLNDLKVTLRKASKDLRGAP